MSQTQSAQQGQQTKPPGPPYAPQIWLLGGRPSKSVDIPITAVFLALYIVSAVTHMTIFQRNKKRGHKFIMSALLFGFSMSRIVTTVMRIASVSLPKDVSLALAAQIFTAAGVVLVYIINLIFAQRILRASHPHLGWHKLFGLAFKIIYVLIVLTIAMVITVTIQSMYTLNPNIRKIDRSVQLAGITFFAVVSFLPIPLVFFGLILPRRSKLEKFGSGRWRTKIQILITSSLLICFGATYRAAGSWKTPVPLSQPMPRYLHKAAFYCVNFVVELLVLFLYAVLRVDRRFHVPNGAKGPGSYSATGENTEKDVAADDKKKQSPPPLRFYTEEETFDQDEWAQRKQEDLEAAQSPSEASWKEDHRVGHSVSSPTTTKNAS